MGKKAEEASKPQDPTDGLEPSYLEELENDGPVLTRERIVVGKVAIDHRRMRLARRKDET